MKEYIERDYLVKEAEATLMFRKQFYMDNKYIQDAADTVEWLKYYAPAADVVSKELYKQIKWERDVAIAQLEEYGVSLGEKADVVEVRHGRWVWNENAMDWGIGGWVCSECRAKNDNIPAKPDIHPSAWVGSHYCPHCGALMDKEE